MSTVDAKSSERELACARVSAASPDGLARAVVDGSGNVVDLILEPSLLRRDINGVAKEVVAAVGCAQEAARALGRKNASDPEAPTRVRLDARNTLVSDLIQSKERIRSARADPTTWAR